MNCVENKLDRLVFTNELHKDILPGVSRTNLWRWVRDGKFPKPLRIGRRKVWKFSAIQRWLDTQTITVDHLAPHQKRAVNQTKPQQKPWDEKKFDAMIQLFAGLIGKIDLNSVAFNSNGMKSYADVFSRIIDQSAEYSGLKKEEKI